MTRRQDSMSIRLRSPKLVLSGAERGPSPRRGRRQGPSSPHRQPCPVRGQDRIPCRCASVPKRVAVTASDRRYRTLREGAVGAFWARRRGRPRILRRVHSRLAHAAARRTLRLRGRTVAGERAKPQPGARRQLHGSRLLYARYVEVCAELQREPTVTGRVEGVEDIRAGASRAHPLRFLEASDTDGR